MKLGIAERLMIQGLSLRGDIVSMKIVRDLQADLGFSEAEIKEAVMKVDGKHVTWDKEIEKEVEIGSQAMAVIKAALEELNEAKQLTVGHIPVYEKFCK